MSPFWAVEPALASRRLEGENQGRNPRLIDAGDSELTPPLPDVVRF